MTVCSLARALLGRSSTRRYMWQPAKSSTCASQRRGPASGLQVQAEPLPRLLRRNDSEGLACATPCAQATPAGPVHAISAVPTPHDWHVWGTRLGKFVLGFQRTVRTAKFPCKACAIAGKAASCLRGRLMRFEYMHMPSMYYIYIYTA